MSEEIKNLSKNIVEYSINVQPNENVLIIYYSEEELEMVKQLIKQISIRGGNPNYKKVNMELESLLLRQDNENVIDLLVKQLGNEVNMYDSFISMGYIKNEYENKNVSLNMINSFGIKSREIKNIKLNKRKWVIFNYPSLVAAYKAHMSIDEFRKYSFEVMNVDYRAMYRKLLPLKELMEKTDKVRMVGPNTDIRFSIKGMPAIPCCGTNNIPDGEIYTAPIIDSVNGVITYNTPSAYRGNIFYEISLTFENGKIVSATCKDDEKNLNDIFDTDEGARYIGEFSFGLNPKILYPMGDILYDEKIKGSIHFTPGNAYANCDNGNRSAIHWDLVWIQREEYGGGEVYFDDILIRKDGVFILDELKELNNL